MTTEELVEAEVREVEEDEVGVEPQRALIVTSGGTSALATLTDDEFEARLTQLARVRDRIDQIKRAIMVPGVDYGEPFAGSDKAMLYKAGAETLLRGFNLADTYHIDERFGDGVSAPSYSVVVHSQIHLGDASGPVIAEGVGAANTWETKHRYRGQQQRTCPDCGKANIIKSRQDDGWWCGTRDGGCGHSFPANDPRITSQPTGRAENADPMDLANTVIKMGKKRAQVDGVLTATGASRLFTQDEDAPGHGDRPQPARNGPPRDAGPRGGTSGPATQPGASTAGTDDEQPLPQGVLQAVVDAVPEGHVRMVRDGHTPKRWQGERSKLEVVTKIGNRKHTAIVTGPLAEATALRQLAIGTPIRFVGAWVEEIQWSDDPKKPKRKEVLGLPDNDWLMRDVQLFEDGQWTSVLTSMPSLGLPAAASSPASTTGTSTAPSSAAASAPAPDSTASDEAASGGPSSPPAESPDVAPTPTPERANSTPTPARMLGTVGEWGTFKAKLLDPIQFTTKGDHPVAILRVADLATGEIILAAVGEDIEGQVGTKADPLAKPGDELGLYGEWVAGGWLVVSAVGR